MKLAPGHLESVYADDDTLDPRRVTFGVDPAFTEFYRQEAETLARKKQAFDKKHPPLPRDADVDLLRIGLKTTFKSPEDALKHFESLNLSFFENPLLDDLDTRDVTRGFMDSLEVGRGRKIDKSRKFVRLKDTPRGREILSEQGHRQVRAMLKYLFGLAKRRRWEAVPWNLVDRYVDTIADLLGAEADRQHVSQGTAGIVYPLASGQVGAEEFLVRVSDELGRAKAKKIVDVRNSQTLWQLVSGFEKLLHPPKNGGKRTPRCLPPRVTRLLKARLKVLKAWAQRPSLVPEWACMNAQEYEDLALCSYPALWEDLRRARGACQDPYDPQWPAALRHEHRRAGKSAPTGIYPLGQETSEELELPWEQAAAANPRSRRGAPVASIHRDRDETRSDRPAALSSSRMARNGNSESQAHVEAARRLITRASQDMQKARSHLKSRRSTDAVEALVLVLLELGCARCEASYGGDDDVRKAAEKMTDEAAQLLRQMVPEFATRMVANPNGRHPGGKPAILLRTYSTALLAGPQDIYLVFNSDGQILDAITTDAEDFGPIEEAGYGSLPITELDISSAQHRKFIKLSDQLQRAVEARPIHRPSRSRPTSTQLATPSPGAVSAYRNPQKIPPLGNWNSRPTGHSSPQGEMRLYQWADLGEGVRFDIVPICGKHGEGWAVDAVNLGRWDPMEIHGWLDKHGKRTRLAQRAPFVPQVAQLASRDYLFESAQQAHSAVREWWGREVGSIKENPRFLPSLKDRLMR